jgi:hypothetical protein
MKHLDPPRERVAAYTARYRSIQGDEHCSTPIAEAHLRAASSRDAIELKVISKLIARHQIFVAGARASAALCCYAGVVMRTRRTRYRM